MADFDAAFADLIPQAAPQSAPAAVQAAPSDGGDKFASAFADLVPQQKPFGLADTWPARMAKSIYSAVTLPGDVYQGKVAPGSDEEIKRSFDLAGVVSPAAPSAALARPDQIPALLGPKPSAATPSVEDLESAYRAVRNSPEVKTATVPIQDVKDLAITAEGQLLADGYRPTPKSAPGTFGEIDRLRPASPPEPTPLQKLQAEMNWETLPEQPQVTQASVDDLLAAKRAFGNVAKERNPFPDMRPTVDASAASKVMPQLDAMIEEAAPGMKEANTNYARAQAARSLDTRFDKAESGAATANSGMNAGNKIRQAANALLYNPNATRGLKPQEMQMLKAVAEGNASRNAIRWASNVLGGGGGLGAVIVGEAASHHLGPIGWLLSPLGHVLKHVEGHMTAAAARKVSDAIRSSSPLGQAIQSSAEKWNAAREAMVGKPTSAKFAAFSIASRNLSNNLASAGVNIHPMRLIRSLQGPMPAGAEDEQQ